MVALAMEGYLLVAQCLPLGSFVSVGLAPTCTTPLGEQKESTDYTNARV
jgi:hypothetical protein